MTRGDLRGGGVSVYTNGAENGLTLHVSEGETEGERLRGGDVAHCQQLAVNQREL